MINVRDDLSDSKCEARTIHDVVDSTEGDNKVKIEK